MNDINKLLEKFGANKVPDYTLKRIAAIIENSIKKNFVVGGRYSGTGLFDGGGSKWKPLAKSTVKRYMALGVQDTSPLEHKSYKGYSGDLGLQDAIEVNVRNRKLELSAKKPYARIHQFGGTINHPGGTAYGFKTENDAKSDKFSFLKAGEGYMVLGQTQPHQIRIPPRPYMVLQDEDIQQAKDIIFEDYFDFFD